MNRLRLGGKSRSMDAQLVQFLAQQMLSNAMTGEESSGTITFNDWNYKVTIRKVEKTAWRALQAKFRRLWSSARDLLNRKGKQDVRS